MKFLSKAILALFAPFGPLSIALAGYAWFRCVDDVFDGDAAPPRGKARLSYLSDREYVINAIRSGSSLVIDPEDRLIEYALHKMDSQGVDIRQELVNIWDSMAWVERLRLTQTPATRDEVIRYASMDDAGVMGVCVKAFGGDVAQFKKIAPSIRGIFMRIDMLSDILEDIQKGIVNIPSESALAYNINIPLVRACHSWIELRQVPGFESWYRDEADVLEKDFFTVSKLIHVNKQALFPSRFIWFLFNQGALHRFKLLLEQAKGRA